MNIGIIGSGLIGGTLARRLSQLGHDVSISNSRGPASLRDLARETGSSAVTVHEAARHGDIVIIAIPEFRISTLPKDLFDGVNEETIVVDTGNYYPKERDGKIDAIEAGMTESGWVAEQIGRPVLKAFNTIFWLTLLEDGKASGLPGRITLPVAGDNREHKSVLIRLVDELGFDAIDGGALDESWRQQPGTPVYDSDLDIDSARNALADASPVRKAEFRASSK